MGAQNMGRAIVPLIARHIECVVLLPGGMFRRDVERVEIVPVAFDLRAFRDRKAHIRKDHRKLVHHLRDRMDTALGPVPPRHRDIDRLFGQPRRQRCVRQNRLARRDRLRQPVAQGVQQRSRHFAHLWRHLAQFAHLQRNFTLFAQSLHPNGLQRRLVTCGFDEGLVLFAKRVTCVHCRSLAV